jgi:hypothetical protein
VNGHAHRNFEGHLTQQQLAVVDEALGVPVARQGTNE